MSDRVPWILAAVMFAACLAAIVLGPAGDVTPAAGDQNDYHLPVIESFARQLPAPDLRNYDAATGPLWQLFLAIPARYGVGPTGLRAVSAAAGAALVLLVALVAVRLAGEPRAAWLALPTALCPYVLMGSIWITTDVPSMLALAACLAAAMLGGRGTAWLLAAGAGIRQTGLWMVPPAMLLQWCDQPPARTAVDRARSAVRVAAPAIVVVGILTWLWGGLTPPAFRDMHDRGVNLATPAFTLALVAVWGTPLLGCAAAGLRRSPRAWLAAAALSGAVAALAVPTSYAMDAGRWGGPLWTAVQRAPVIAERSLALAFLAPVGAVTLLLLLRRAREAMPGAVGPALAMAVLAIGAVDTFNTQCFERYADIPLLVVLPWLAAAGMRGATDAARGRVVAGAVLLGLVQAALSGWMVAQPLLAGLVWPGR